MRIRSAQGRMLSEQGHGLSSIHNHEDALHLNFLPFML